MGEQILFRAIKPSCVLRSLSVFGKTFKENSVEVLSMNSNINILGVYYVNPCFSGALDKINGSKEQALKAAGEILWMCCATWRLAAELRAHWSPALPSCSSGCCHGTIKFCHHVAQPFTAGLCLKNLFSPCFVAEAVKFLQGRTGLCISLTSPWHCMAQRDEQGDSKPSLCAGANIWGGSSLALANTLKFLRLVDNDLSRQRGLGADKPRDLCIVYKYLAWPSLLTWGVMLELCPGWNSIFGSLIVQDGTDRGSLHVGPHASLSPCAASFLDEPQSYFTFFFSFFFSLVMSSKSLSLLPQLHTQIPPVPSHQSRVLIHFGKAQPHVQHPFSCCPTVATTHLPHQHPCSSSGLHTLKVMPKAVGWPIKMAWSRRGKRY